MLTLLQNYGFDFGLAVFGGYAIWLLIYYLKNKAIKGPPGKKVLYFNGNRTMNTKGKLVVTRLIRVISKTKLPYLYTSNGPGLVKIASKEQEELAAGTYERNRMAAPSVNPSTGLPMTDGSGGVDVTGTPWGTDKN